MVRLSTRRSVPCGFCQQLTSQPANKAAIESDICLKTTVVKPVNLYSVKLDLLQITEIDNTLALTTRISTNTYEAINSFMRNTVWL